MLFKWFSRLLHTLVFIVSLYFFSSVFAPILIEASPMTNAFINEIHYDNTGIDSGEYVEIVSDGNIDLTNWSLLLYNGNNGAVYDSFEFDSWSYISTNAQFDLYTIETEGIQNGSPDGVALYDGANIIQFLSYEGSFTATNGIAEGITSIDIGVSESFNTPERSSLQLIGQGSTYYDFTWSSSQESTFGTSNTGQQFINPISNVTSVDEPNSLLSFVLILMFYLFYQNRIAP